MCGLVGIAGNLFKPDVDIFNELLVADTFRGHHSTGVAAVPADKQWAPTILKSTVPGWELVENDRRYDSTVSVSSHILMGHNRHATVGQVTKRNAHPFWVHDFIVGMHNGTLTNKNKLADHGKFGTDSEAALSSFATLGAIETLQLIEGAWAFVWFDYKKRTLNFTRNSQRPLSIVRSKKNDKLAWASEADMLRWILGRDRRKLDEWEEITSVSENHVLSFTVPEKVTEPFGKPRLAKYEESVPRTYGSYGGVPRRTYGEAYDAYYGREDYGATGAATAPGKQKLLGTKGKPLVSLDKVPLTSEEFAKQMQATADTFEYRDANGNTLKSDEEIKTYVQGHSCAMCGSPIQPEELWRSFAPKEFVCETCISEEGTADYLKAQLGVTLQ